MKFSVSILFVISMLLFTSCHCGGGSSADSEESYSVLEGLVSEMDAILGNDYADGIMNTLELRETASNEISIASTNESYFSTAMVIKGTEASCNAGGTYRHPDLNQFINQKFFIPNGRVVVDKFFEYTCDGYGRTERVHAVLCKAGYLESKGGDVDLLRSESRGTLKKIADLKDGNGAYVGGHLIGNYFNGPTEAINIVPMSQKLNRRDWAKMEKKMKKAYDAGESVTMDILIHYSGTSSVPQRIDVEIQMNGGREQFSFPF